MEDDNSNLLSSIRDIVFALIVLVYKTQSEKKREREEKLSRPNYIYTKHTKKATLSYTKILYIFINYLF